MRELFDSLKVRGMDFGHFHQKTLDYIEANEEYVEDSNRKMLIRVSFIIMLMTLAYFILSFNVFASWHVTHIYATNLIINGAFLIFFLTRYLKDVRTVKEVMVVCSIYQFYIMNFLVVISLSPFEMESPAVYFAPLGIVFAVVFITPWRWLVSLITLECLEMIVASYIVKSPDIFSINLFSTVVALFVFIYIARILYNFRISENNAKGKLRAQAGIDKLTGLYNKGQMEHLCLEYFNAHDEDMAIMVIDFDNFKKVNDTFGHQQGDQVLKEFGALLSGAVRKTDFVGRIGGDEFMIMLTDIPGRDVAARVADYVVEGTHKILSKELVFDFSCSIGIALRSQDPGCNYDQLFANADRAVYQTKNHGKNGKTFYSREMQDDASIKTVLVVDPVKVSRNILVSCLSGMRVFESKDGAAALQFLDGRETEIDTIMVDLDESNTHVQELLDMLAAHPNADKHTTFLIKNKDQKVDYNIGSLRVEYITKPFDTQEIAEKVREAVG